MTLGRKMRTFICFLCCAVVVHAAPSSYERTIVKEMTERYDFVALAAFLKESIQRHPTFGGVSLRDTRVGSKWRFEKVDPPRRMRSGDWVIWDQKDEDEALELYTESGATHVVIIRAKRVAKNKFEFLGNSIDEWVSLE
jgi:hypothetical protein